MRQNERQKSKSSDTWMFLVERTAEIIEHDGIKSVTVRKVSQATGYTSSSVIYNYFGDLSHLIFFAAMRFLSKYIEDVQSYYSRGDTYLDKFLLTWECFCKHSFTQPDIYYAIFMAEVSTSREQMYKQYYSYFERDLQGLPEEIKPLLLESNISIRNRDFLHMAMKDKYVKNDFVDEINDLVILIWKGMMITYLNNPNEFGPNKAVDIAMRYIRIVINKLF